MVIMSDNLIFRPISVEDTDVILSFRNSEAVKANYLYRKDISREEHLDWLKNKVDKGLVKQFVIEEKAGGRPVGSVYFKDIDPDKKSAEYGIFIGDPLARGRGYGSETAVRMVAWFFGDFGYEELRLRVFARNIPAIRSYEKAGFKVSGTDEYTDTENHIKEKVLIMGLSEDEYRKRSI